jgi:hypothetical protein
MLPNRGGTVSFDFEEEEWQNRLDGLYEMFVYEEAASYEARAGAHPSM